MRFVDQDIGGFRSGNDVRCCCFDLNDRQRPKIGDLLDVVLRLEELGELVVQPNDADSLLERDLGNRLRRCNQQQFRFRTLVHDCSGDDDRCCDRGLAVFLRHEQEEFAQCPALRFWIVAAEDDADEVKDPVITRFAVCRISDDVRNPQALENSERLFGDSVI